MELRVVFLIAGALFTFCRLTYCDTAQNVPAEPVPYYVVPPTPPREILEAPIIRAVEDSNGETITLKNYAVTAELRIDTAKHIWFTGLRTGKGTELLSNSSSCFGIAGADGKLIKDGSTFTVQEWHSWLHPSETELEIRLLAPEPIVWRLKLYRDKPYLEQRFEIPQDWRSGDRTLVTILSTSSSLRPVMPVNALKLGFKEGVSKAPGHNRFEFVSECEHLVYDPDQHVGLAAFVAGPGGEEKLTVGKTILADHATPTLGADDPLSKMLFFPFEGPVENGFARLRHFIADEYSCQGDKQSVFAWNQFWLWQGKHPDWAYHEVTADRLVDILPHIQAMGVGGFHLDAGWEIGTISTPRSEAKDWVFDPIRFPEGFAPIRKYLREHGMSYITHLWQAAVNRPDIISKIVGETDLDKLFIDANANEETLACLRMVRKKYPNLEVFVHSMNDAHRATSYWKWGNIHYLSDMNQVYFGEGTWQGFVSGLPPYKTEARFIDQFTRTAAYQAGWIWPYKCIVPPHAGYTMAGQEWRIRPMDVNTASSLILTTIAARYMYEWGDDPRLVKPETLNFFLDWTAFWKTFRPYWQEYQHILPPPDGIHPDGMAHMMGDTGLIFIFNPSDKPAKVSWKEILWSPELELDPRKPLELSDWAKPLSPRKLGSMDLLNPKGSLSVEPQGYRVIGVNLNLRTVKAEVNRQRSLIFWPPNKTVRK